MTDNIANPTWVAQNDPMGDVPVMDLKQQINYHADQVVNTIFHEGNETYLIPVVYEGIHNQGMIYAATYGRGLFRCENFRKQEYQSVPEIPAVVEVSTVSMSLTGLGYMLTVETSTTAGISGTD